VCISYNADTEETSNIKLEIFLFAQYILPIEKGTEMKKLHYYEDKIKKKIEGSKMGISFHMGTDLAWLERNLIRQGSIKAVTFDLGVNKVKEPWRHMWTRKEAGVNDHCRNYSYEKQMETAF